MFFTHLEIWRCYQALGCSGIRQAKIVFQTQNIDPDIKSENGWSVMSAVKIFIPHHFKHGQVVYIDAAGQNVTKLQEEQTAVGATEKQRRAA